MSDHVERILARIREEASLPIVEARPKGKVVTAVYRQAILNIVEERRWTVPVIETYVPPSRKGKHPQWQPPPTVKQEGTFEVAGRSYAVKIESTAFLTDFVKFRPDNKYATWATYWRRGNGMKVFGPYDDFERDIVLLKTFA
jgi:hypothetical protein